MVNEHDNVERMIKVIRKYSYKVLQDEDIDYDDFYKIIDFIRNYTDGHHHAKEENILFKAMGEKMPNLIENGPLTGMLIEHDNARLYVLNLEEALEEYKKGKDEARLDIIANAISYGDLLSRHVDKENKAIYTFAEKILPEDIKEEVDRKCAEIEKAAEEEGIQQKYMDLLEELEKKIG